MFSQFGSLSELSEELGKTTGTEALSHIHCGACENLKTKQNKKQCSKAELLKLPCVCESPGDLVQ